MINNVDDSFLNKNNENVMECNSSDEIIQQNHNEISFDQLTKEITEAVDNISCDEQNVEKNNDKCNICGKRFSPPSRLIAHMKHHNHNCKLCCTTFTSYALLMSHQAKVHSICPFTKVIRPALPEDVQITCPLCPGKVFKKKKALLSHNSVIHGEKKVQCSQCPKKFAFQSQLIRHEVHHNHKCDYCDAVFGNYFKLQKHTKENHGDALKKPNKTYSCPECEIVFPSHESMKKHHASEHTNEIFECTICQRKYYHKRNLKMHIKRIHEKEKIVCEVKNCGTEFTTQFQLDRHTKSHEKEDSVSAAMSDSSIIELIASESSWRRKHDIE